ncbi:MAG TPA: class I SAM-dependent methyltransferase [Thermomicrobiales bacterium]|nr:class I SAM-dependent methyltransferase [Thermomicrobiales bacterium]
MRLERFRFYHISLGEHLICNPTSIEKLNRMIELLRIPEGGRLLDIACGKGEFLVRAVERYGCAAVGVDMSQYAIADAREKVAARVPDADVELIEADGSAYDGPYASFDSVSCLGASWIWQGHAGTLRALARWARPGGYVLVGEPFWKREPDPEYLEAANLKADDFGTHRDNVEAGIRLGLTPVYTAVSTDDEWDHYETLQWYAAERWARKHPDDPDRDEVLRRAARERESYLRWGRDTLGWALYLFRK